LNNPPTAVGGIFRA